MKIIEAKGIGKKYNINHQKGGYVALRDVLTNIFKNPFAFLKTKAKDVLGIDTKEEFWALRDINFEINKGEVVGIIGRNGAGKSTLLKILSQITPPTTGEIKIHGTVGSLLEVGTGFHPELTGRENIFLNGAILGMKKSSIIKKFDEIVKFAGVEKFLDTPVKYYSSGMYVRLAFSVAAHMDSDILIIDEVLAVGDSDFQKKCLGKMEEITNKEGRTILFVSHNMDTIRRLCKKTILLKDGGIEAIGDTDIILKNYVGILETDRDSFEIKSGLKKIVLKKIVFKQQDQSFSIIIDSQEKISSIRIGLGINSVDSNRITTLLSNHFNKKLDIIPGSNEFVCTIPLLPIKPGYYYIDILVGNDSEVFLFSKEKYSFTINNSIGVNQQLDDSQGYVIIDQNWSKK